MLCELCHRNEAAGVLHRKDSNGEDEELYVCKDCLNSGTKGKGSGKTEKPTIVTEDGEEPPAFIKNFLDAAVGLIEGVTGSEPPKPKRCHVCGMTWAKIKESGKIGCPDCWAQFGKEIRHEFLPHEYGPKHTGRIPEKAPDGKPSRAFLEKELKDAVARQDYRKAARLRKLLDEFYGGGKGDGQ